MAGQPFDDASDDRPFDDRQHRLRYVVGERAKARSRTADEDERPITLLGLFATGGRQVLGTFLRRSFGDLDADLARERSLGGGLGDLRSRRDEGMTVIICPFFSATLVEVGEGLGRSSCGPTTRPRSNRPCRHRTGRLALRGLALLPVRVRRRSQLCGKVMLVALSLNFGYELRQRAQASPLEPSKLASF